MGWIVETLDLTRIASGVERFQGQVLVSSVEEERDSCRACISEVEGIHPLFACRFAESFASRDHAPPPISSRKIRPSSMLTSVRASWSVLQNPFFANTTILV